MRLMVVSEKPRCGSTKGAAISAMIVSASTMKGRFVLMQGPSSLAARRAEESIGADHQHKRHRHEKHDVGIAGVEHRCDADDLAGDEAAEDRARKRADATDDDDDEGLNEDRFPDVG